MGTSSGANGGDGGIAILTANTPRFIVNAQGSVGIGTTNPSEKLDVNGNVHVTGSLKLERTGSNPGIWLFQQSHETSADSGSMYVVPSSNTQRWHFVNKDYGKKMVIDPETGRVGIGSMTSPERTLHLIGNDGKPSGSISGNSDTQLFIENAGNNGAMIEINTDSNSTGRIMFGSPAIQNAGRIEYKHSYHRFDTWVEGGSVENKRTRKQGEDFRTPGTCGTSWNPSKSFATLNWHELGNASVHSGNNRWIRIETPQYYSSNSGGGWAQFDLVHMGAHATPGFLFSWKLVFGQNHGRTFSSASTGITKLKTSPSYSPYDFNFNIELYGGTGSDADMRYLYIKIIGGISYYGGSNASNTNNKILLTVDGTVGHIDAEYVITDLGRLSSPPSNITGVMYSA
jgi:hypothetical protein